MDIAGYWDPTIRGDDRLWYSTVVPWNSGACTMHITSPFFVVPVIVVVFTACILFATSSKEDGPAKH
jgi:hypothetical protein